MATLCCLQGCLGARPCTPSACSGSTRAVPGYLCSQGVSLFVLRVVESFRMVWLGLLGINNELVLPWGASRRRGGRLLLAPAAVGLVDAA